MKKVYDDRSLGYSQKEEFQLPEGFDPCNTSEIPDSDIPEETGLDDLFN